MLYLSLLRPRYSKEAEDLHIIDHWCYLGTATNEDEVFELIQNGQVEFDLDIYKIIKKNFIKLPSAQLLKLPARHNMEQGY